MGVKHGLSDYGKNTGWKWSSPGCWGRCQGVSNRRVEKNAQWGASWFVHLVKYDSGDQIKDDEKWDGCNTHGGEEKCTQGFWSGKFKQKGPLRRSRRPWGNINIDLRRTGWSGVGRINLAQNGDKCRVPLNVGKISIPWEVLSVSRMNPLFVVNTARKLDGLCNVP